jgi:hypothetical protein
MLLRRLSRLAEIDRGTILAMMVRAWQILAGPVTMVLIARSMSPAVQGFYYTFASFLALQSFVELGFSAAVVPLASHEWASLGFDGDGRIQGDREAVSRLISLGRLVFRWYATASVLFVLGAGMAGYGFFLQDQSTSVAWKTPWILMVSLTGITLALTPVSLLLEGCNQIAPLQSVRLVQAVFSSLALWGSLYGGLGLWSGVLAAGVGLSREPYLLFVKYRRFFSEFLSSPGGSSMHWRSEIWPMQWRLAISGLFGYCAFSLFNPVMFHYHGAAVAGQMGMTWAISNSLQTVGIAWVQSKVPQFAIFIARKEYENLHRFFRRTLLASLAVMAIGAVAIGAAIVGLNLMDFNIAKRLLPPIPACMFLLSTIILHIGLCETAYLRAHKREPIVGLMVFLGTSVAVSVWTLGGRFGPLGAAASYLSIIVLSTIWWTKIWVTCRKEWHSTS